MAFGDFVVEDGTGLANATSYVSVAEATNYCTTHRQYQGVWGLMEVEARQSALMHGTRWLDEEFEWLGRVYRYGTSNDEQAQALRFPRVQIWDKDGRYLVVYDSDAQTVAIPDRIKEATCEATLMHVASAVNAFSADGQAAQGPIEEITVDVIEVVFSNGGSNGAVIRNPDKAHSRRGYIKRIVAPYVSSRGVYR